MKHILIMLGCLLALSACIGGGSGGAPIRSSSGGSDNQPDWVMNPPKSGQFLYGVGVAKLGEHEQAKTQARRDLASQIQVSIDSARVERLLGTKKMASNKTAVETIERKIDDKIQTKVNITDLPGIEQAERVDGKKNTYILVKMDRAAWARSIRLQVVDLDGNIQSAYDTVQKHMASGLNELQQAMRLYKELVPLFSKRTMLEDRYRLAAPASSLAKPPVDPVMIRTKLATLLLAITISLPQDQAAKPLLPGITEACASRGLQVLDNPTNAMLKMEFSVKEVKRLIDGTIRIDGTVSGSIKDSKGRVLGALEAVGRGGGGTEGSARMEMFQELSGKIVDALEDQLFTYLTRL